jgi:catalase
VVQPEPFVVYTNEEKVSGPFSGKGPDTFSLPFSLPIVIVGQPGDPTSDATLPWPAGREEVEVGTVTLDKIESDDTSEARDINFDPLVLPVGIAPSDDPLLSARSAVYSKSFTRRAGETKQPSAITPAEVRKGQ